MLQTRKRALQLQTSAEISQVSASILELERLLPQAVELIRDRFSLYYVGIFLNDEEKEWAVLRAGTGEAGRVQIEAGHRLAVAGNSMIGQCVLSSQARIALECGGRGNTFSKSLPPPHPLRDGAPFEKSDRHYRRDYDSV
ncbi:MAG: hypothetical protein HC806_06040 [Anaerolineae bacterium]|nr:hypothetical protein [Anaerolineae bacterium]